MARCCAALPDGWGRSSMHCIPILMMDANCHVGLERVDSTWVLSSGLGVFGAERQPANAAGYLEALTAHRFIASKHVPAILGSAMTQLGACRSGAGKWSRSRYAQHLTGATVGDSREAWRQRRRLAGTNVGPQRRRQRGRDAGCPLRQRRYA
eukprot:3598375-Amphidinium_carterae.2